VAMGTITLMRHVNHSRLDISVVQQQTNYRLDTGPVRIYGLVKAVQLRVHQKVNKVSTNGRRRVIRF